MSWLNDKLPADLELNSRLVSSFLGASGWSIDDDSTYAERWSIPDGNGTARVLLPTDSTFDDFDRRFNETLRALCAMNDWDVFQLANAIVSIRSDILRLRADQLIRYDSIPIKQASDLIDGAVQMMTAAARSTIEPRPSHRGARPKPVANFVDNDVRMGHTQRGSFVITILTRLDESVTISSDPSRSESDDVPTDLNPEGERATSELATGEEDEISLAPFQRRVMSTLANALVLAPDVQQQSDAAIERAIQTGVSAQLYDSLSKMTSFEGLRSLDMSFRWAPALPENHPEIEDIAIGRDEIPIYKSLGDKFRNQDSPTRQTLYGYVIRLEWDESVSANNVATATVRGVVGRNQRRQAKVRVVASTHDIAVAAYHRRVPVTVTGDLEKRGNGYQMADGATVALA